jgi:hypothetical protein
MKTPTDLIRHYINLIESKSADLYHGTSLDGADGILKSDYLEVNTWGTHEFDNDSVYPSVVKGADEAASLTRSFSVARQYATNDRSGAVIVLDQGLLARDLGSRIRPVDAHGFDRRGWSGRRSKDEELAWGGIDKVKKYIKNVYVFIEDPEELEDFRTLKSYPKLTIVDRSDPSPTTRILQHQLSKKTPGSK